MTRKPTGNVKQIRELRVTKKPPLEQLVAKLVGNCMKALERKEASVTIADLFRLREFRRELAPRESAGTNVTWLDSGMERSGD